MRTFYDLLGEMNHKREHIRPMLVPATLAALIVSLFCPQAHAVPGTDQSSRI
jgi:hypothetical protein